VTADPSPHIPEELPAESIDLESMIPQIVDANTALARFDGQLSSIQNPRVLLSPLMTQEAVVSSKIEGTQATLEEVLEHEADQAQPEEQSKRDDIEEIINYRRALSYAEESLVDRPFNLNLLKEMHGILMDGVRGQNKRRGEFRRQQIHIGPPGSSREDATYIPPPYLKLSDLLDNWEAYYHTEPHDRLVQLGILHAQFEMIHPFLDGNGRIGRLLIPLFLHDKGVLSSPTFYASAYLEQTREEYYERLSNISEEGDWEGWIRYFLAAVKEQSEANSEKVGNITDLYEDTKGDVVDLISSKYTIQAIDALFERPIFTSSRFQDISGIPKQTSYRMLRELCEGGVITRARESSGRQPALYLFQPLLEIVGTYR
jgi:Fic family protein